MRPQVYQPRLFPMLELSTPPASDVPSTAPVPDFLATLKWRESADPLFRVAAAEGRTRRLAKRLRKAGIPAAARPGQGVAPVCDLLAELLPAGDSQAVVHLTRETLRAVNDGADRDALTNHVAALLDAAGETSRLPLEVLAVWLGLLPAVARRVEPDILFRYWQRSLQETRFTAEEFDSPPVDPTDISAELRDEVLFRAGILFAQLEEAEAWLAAGREGWRHRILQAGEGMSLVWSQSESFSFWLAALVRVLTDAALFDVPIAKKSHARALRRFAVRVAARLLPDRSLAGRRSASPASPQIIGNLVRLAGGEERDAAERLVRDVARGRSRRSSNVRSGRASRPAYQSDEERFALLRGDWSARAAVCGLNYSESVVQIDVAIAGERLLHGPWDLSVAIDGHRVSPRAGWKCDCWFSDRDGDFAEISTPLGDGVSLMRQIFLGRREQVLLVVEAVRGAARELPVSWQSTMPVPAGVAPVADGLTREIQWPIGRERVRMFPLHLPWERTTTGAGNVHLTEAGLQMTIAGQGNLCQMLVFDWRHRDLEAPADGACLSVAERGRHVSPHEACAGRVRVGKRQWFYWHNLTAGEVPRSCLGHHTADETVWGRIQSNGEIDILVHVQGETPQESNENA